MTTRVDPLSIEELYGHLLAHKIRLEQQQLVIALTIAVANFARANFTGQGNARGGRGGKHNSSFSRGTSSSNQKNNHGSGCGHGNAPSSFTSHLICQVCNKAGHSALNCYHRYDNSYSRNSFNMHALLTTPQSTFDLNWYPDFGATHHLIADLANLNVRADEYHVSDQIQIGNSLDLNVKHIGSTKLSTPTSSFLLHDVLQVPLITKNLISVHKFTNDTNTSIEFHPTYFIVKDRTMEKVLLHRLSKNGLYLFPSTFNKIPLLSSAFIGEHTSPNQWHSCLGHPVFHVVHHILSRFSLPFSSNKIIHPKQLPFALSCTQIDFPLELIFTDV